MRGKDIQEMAWFVGLSVTIDRSTPGWPRYSFIRQGDAMCVAEVYATKWAEYFIRGYSACIQYPPSKKHTVTEVVSKAPR
jgi:hypothetical protein